MKETSSFLIEPARPLREESESGDPNSRRCNDIEVQNQRGSLSVSTSDGCRPVNF